MIWALLTVLSLGAVSMLVGFTLKRAAGRSRQLQAQRDRWEAKCRNANLKLEAVSETSGAAIVMVDSSGKVVHANSTAAKLLSTDGETPVGCSLLDFPNSSNLLAIARDTLASGVPGSRDVAMEPANVVMRVSAFPFEQGLSGDAETMLVMVDVTELRRLETVRRDFVANVSHELRTPLASIRAMAESLQDGALTDKRVATRFLETIIRESDRLTRISEDLLILSDAESKNPEIERFNLAELIEEVATRFVSKAEHAGVSLRVACPASLDVRASVDQIEQVIVNLIDNAVKYTPSGGTVVVSVDRTAETVVVKVEDTGIGIMPEHVSRLFERFYRADKARSRASGGTGLGLSIVKNIVETHGGHVGVDSQIGKGSTFWFEIPAEPAPVSLAR